MYFKPFKRYQLLTKIPTESFHLADLENVSYSHKAAANVIFH
jgi:hypothetical protein